MSVHEQHSQKLTKELTDTMNDLVSHEEGIPRPIISIEHTLPFQLPVHQRAVTALRKLADTYRDEYNASLLRFLVHPYEDPTNKRVMDLLHPYAELTVGDVLGTLDDGSPIKLVTLTVKDIPANWRSEKPLDLYIEAHAKNKRYGEVIARAARINLRVPRFAIKGKESGI